MLKVSIVIPVYGNWALTHQLLFDLYQYNRDVDEILIVNDGIDDPETYKGFEWWKGNLLPHIRMLDLKENKGFLRASNIGIKKATGDVIMLVSNDVRIQDDIVKVVRNIYAGEPKMLVGGILYQNSTGWNEFKNGKKPNIFPYIEGWMLICTKAGWEELGGFDEQYAPHDFEDVDLSTTAISKGYTLTPLSSDKVRHIGSQTIKYSPEREALTKRNRTKFAVKWGVTE